MDFSPFTAKVGNVFEQVRLDLFDLAHLEPDVAHQPHLPKVTEQLEARVHVSSHDMHVRRKMVVGVDHHTPASEYGQNGRHKLV
jgi:hypothetical protein